MVKPMPLSAPAVASLIKAKLDAPPPGTAGEKNLHLAEAIVEHLKTYGPLRNMHASAKPLPRQALACRRVKASAYAARPLTWKNHGAFLSIP